MIDTEMERKFLVPDEETFGALVTGISPPVTQILEYNLKSFSYKVRPYRYFDTFDGTLAEKEILTSVGPMEDLGASLSVRSREEDYVVTVKIPIKNAAGQREEYEFNLPFGIDLYSVDPNSLSFWEPLHRVRDICGNKPLQEIVRLEVQTNRCELYQGEKRKVEIAVDSVEASIPYPFILKKKFWELEVEEKESGTATDIETIVNFLKGKYPLKESSLPKWVKALRLIRGEELSE